MINVIPAKYENPTLNSGRDFFKTKLPPIFRNFIGLAKVVVRNSQEISKSSCQAHEKLVFFDLLTFFNIT